METKTIGNKITTARKKINISQAQLAQKVFVSPQAVGKWERGESIPDIITLNRVAEILGVDLNYFSDGLETVSTENTTIESSEKRSDESQALNQKTSIKWDMSNGNWLDADFSGLKDLNEKFSSSNILRCQFVGSNLSGLLLKNNNVSTCDFSGSDLSNSQIQRSNIANNLFKDCSLKETEFSGSYVSEGDFTNANLTGMVVRSGGLEKNIITNVTLKHTSFIDTYLVDMVFGGTLEDCHFENCKFTRVTFQDATLINTFFKNNKNLKKIKFIDCKADRMTYAFLKTGGAELSGVSLLTE